MDENRFLALWDRHLAEWCADDLMREGQEAALLRPLAACRWAAVRLVEHASLSEDYRQRKAAAILAGFVVDAPAGLLDDLFERESERAALASPESTEPLACQFVVEDVVLAAARWCRRESSREAGLALLRKAVERTMVGEYWTSASYAMATLCKYEAPGARELLTSFAAFAQGPPPSHPANPTLGTEREFARGLLAGNSAALEAVEVMLDHEEEAASDIEFDEETEATVETWLSLANRIG